ncbi:hypothetical protein N0V88_002736 [Collariella sp. IMI 366227]|nr:hypothetical protein N0V88_002736 [Collariella sp. IMI 366227]
MASENAEILAELRQEITSWCGARSDVSSLDLGALYEELRHLDINEAFMLPEKPGPEHRRPYVSEVSAAVLLADAKRDEIITGFAPRRQLLRDRAADASRDKLRKLNVTDLPLEILRHVFSFLQHPVFSSSLSSGIHWGKLYDGPGYDLDVRQARLVCRVFCDLATPLLFYRLQLRLTQSSLDLIDKISRNPSMASGVRGIQVYLGHRSKHYAQDIAKFKSNAVELLEDYYEACEEYLRMFTLDDEDDEWADYLEMDLSMRDLNQAISRFKLMRDEWDLYVRGLAPGQQGGETHSEWQDFLRHTHAEFSRLYHDQDRMLRDGMFVKTLATAMARMPKARCLSFVDTLEEEWPDKTSEDESAQLLLDNEMISRFIQAPMTWDNWIDAAEMQSVQLLWELPIALHKAGVSLEEIHVGAIPIHYGFSWLCPRNEAGDPAWDDLQLACQSLEIFTVPVGPDNHGSRPLAGEDKANLDNYLSSIISGSALRLRDLQLCFGSLAVTSGWGAEEAFYRLGTVLQALPELPRIRSIGLASVEVDQNDVEALCQKLGTGFESLTLGFVKLVNGDWADVLDVMRPKLAGDAAARVSLSCLIGGAPVSLRPLHDWNFLADCMQWADDRALQKEMVAYLLGRREENPLRGLETYEGPKSLAYD